MKVRVPSEVMADECRVAVAPAGWRDLVGLNVHGCQLTNAAVAGGQRLACVPAEHALTGSFCDEATRGRG